MSPVLTILLTVVGLALAQTDLCSRYGGVCSYGKCSRYYVPPSSAQLCPSAFQRCCVAELCLTRYGGICQRSYYRCDGSSYTHAGSSRLCQQTSDACCITKMPGSKTTPAPVITTPAPVPDKCLNYGGKCVDRTKFTCVNGQFRLVGSSNEVLCNDWLKNNERCCMADNRVSSGVTTPAPKPPTQPPRKPDKCVNYGGRCVNTDHYKCVDGQFRLYGSSNEILCNNWSTNKERCCMADNRASAGATTPAPKPTQPPRVTKAPTPTGSNSQCGIQKVSLLDKRIVGGQTAEKGEWPWQVSIIKSASFSGRSFAHTCGGILISPQWVLTAAHCFKSVNSRYQIRVRVGEHSFMVNEGTENDAVVGNIILHPQYVASQNKNDIALLQLEKPLDITGTYTRTACMPDVNDLADFYRTSECYTTGWGNTRGTGTGNKHTLQEVQSSLVSQQSCYSKWGYKIDSTKVCFGNGYKGACQGDSGGPLVCKKNGLFYVVGVVSYGSQSCTDKYVPTVYTNVAAFRTWISQVMDKYRG